MSIQEKFVIIGFQRTGTSGLQKGLQQVPGISACNYEFAAEMLDYRYFRNEKNASHENIRFQKLVWDELFSQDQTARVVGAKSAVRNARIISHALNWIENHSPETKVIICVRNDVTALLGSLKLAQSTNRWQAWETNKKVKNIYLSKREIAHYCREEILLESIVYRFSLPKMVVRYETDYKNFKEIVSRVARFAGINDPDLSQVIDYGKVAPDAAKYIRNYEELRSYELKCKKALNAGKGLRLHQSLGLSRRLSRIYEALFVPSAHWKH